MPKNEKKNQQFLASAPRFFVSEGAEQIWGQLEYLAAQIFEKKAKICKQILAIFQYKSTETAENDLTSTNRISATARN